MATKTKLITERDGALESPWQAGSSPIISVPAVANEEVYDVLIVGAGPCGLRSAIECALLGAHVVVVDSRDKFTRNNVLHLWKFVIEDLRSLGAKIFMPKFCTGSIEHIVSFGSVSS